MQVLSTIMIVAAVFDLAFAVVVFWKAWSKQKALAGYYFFLFGTLAVWEILMWTAFFRNYGETLNGIIDQFTVVLGIGSLFLFTLFYWVLIDKQFLSKVHIWILAAFNIVVAIVGLVPGTYYKGRIYFSDLPWEQYLEPGVLLSVSYSVAVVNLLGLLYLVFKFWRSDEQHAKRARGLLVGVASIIVLAINFGSSVIVPFTVKSVIESQPITFASWYLVQQIVGIILLSVLSFVVAYAITRYRFLNLKVETHKQTMHRVIQLGTFIGISVVVILFLLPNSVVSPLLAVLLISAISILALGAYAVFFKRRSLVHVLFFITCVSLVIWLISSYISIQVLDLAFVRLHLASTGLFLGAFFCFSYAYTARKPHKGIFALGWVAGLAISAISIWGNTFTAIVTDAAIPYPITGTGMYVFGPTSILLAVVSVALYIPVLLRKEGGPIRNRAAMIMSGFVLMVASMILFSFILVVFFETTRFIPIAMLSTLVFVLLTTVAITRYRFLHIRIEMKQHMAYVAILFVLLFALAAFGVIGADLYGIMASVICILILGFSYFLFVDHHVRFALDSIFFLNRLDPSKAFTYDERKFDSYKAVRPWIDMIYSQLHELDAQCIGLYLLQRQHNRLTDPRTGKHLWLELPFMKEVFEKGSGVYTATAFQEQLPKKMQKSTLIVVAIDKGKVQCVCFIQSQNADANELAVVTDKVVARAKYQVNYYESVEGAKRTVKELIYKDN